MDESTRIEHGIAELKTIFNSGADTANYEVDYQYYLAPKGKLLQYQDSVNDRIINFVRGNTEFEIDHKIQAKLNPAFFSQQLDKFDSISQIEANLDEYFTPWELNMFISIQEHDNYCELELSEWNYTGGAHGNGYTGYHSIRISDGVDLKLTDFINDVPAFTIIAEQYFRSEYAILPMADLEELGYWFTDGKFACNDNFFIDEIGMHFYYNIYEIAPYAAGPIEFAIPLNEISQFLKIQP